MTLDKFVEGDILSTCNALGREIQGIYEKGQHCVECLKDILRYLKRDGDDHSILCFLGSVRVLQNDLLPLIKHFDKDSEVFDFTLRILVALTNPALILYQEDIPDDKLSRNTYLQIISYLQSYKKAFIDIGVWKILFEHLKDLLKIRYTERSNNESLFIERILVLIRNVLHVPSDETVCKQTGDDDSPHDKIIKCLHESKVNILLLYICAKEEEHKFCLHALEIISLMFREHTAETLAKANETRSAAEKEKDLKALLAVREREQKLKIQKIQSLGSSRFNGVYCVKNMKSLSDNDYISHKLITSPDDVKFNSQKDFRRKPKNRAPAPDVDNTRQSTLFVRLLLKKFCIEFLKVYNKLMVSVKRELLRKVGDDHDDSYYLWAICYFMQFNRLYDFQSALVGETISVQSFHYIQTQITNYLEMMLTDKKKTKAWAKRVQLGVSAYKELLETLRVMGKNQDEVVREGADALISHVFYVIEYREMLLSLLSNYDQVKFTLSYLAELVESTQLFLKMLENHSKKHSEIVVQKKQKKVRRRKKKKSPVANNEPVNTEDQLNEQWDSVSSQLSEIVQQKDFVPNDTPFDGASEMSFDEQKIEAVYKIREALVANKPLEAIGLLRAARELWPEGDSFGAVDIDPISEINVLKEIHFSNLQKESSEKKEEEEEEESDYNEEIEAETSVAEQKLDIDDVYKKYANHKVVYPCSLLLANYQNNKPQTNACLVKLLHRIAWNCKMHGLFFQATIFLTFQKIFCDPDVNCNPIIKELYRFAKFIVQKFFHAVEKNDKIFVELLFWKGSREAYELEEGYGTSENKAKIWTEDEEEELKYLFDENKNICIEGQDVADIILANLNTGKRTKLQVIAALKRLGLIESVKDLKPEKRKEWQETEIIELQHLFEDNKHSDDIMGVILNKLSIKRTRKAVVDKLIELNLIADRKEVRKKSSKKRSGKFGNTNSDDDEHSSGDSEDDYMHDRNQNVDSSGDEDEINFFANLDAERLALNASDDDSHSNEKHQTIWEEKQILELVNLFNVHHESDDIMHDILNSLSIKTSKKDVIEKLIELGLIKDKNEIRKKTKQSENRKNGNSQSDISNKKREKINAKKKRKQQILSDSEDDGHNSNVEDSNKTMNTSLSKKKQPKAWKEEEIIQLNELFVKHKDENDVLSNIMSDLTTKRTKKNVIEKMLEIGLIQAKTDLKKNKMFDKGKKSKENVNEVVRKPKSKKSSEVWEESELIELNQLYQNNKNSSDVITDILSGLTLKRNKKDVIEKMLEIGLILDKKEIRKKRITKTVKNKQNLHNMTNMEDNDIDLKNLNSKKKVKKQLSDSSDDENVPLISAASNNSFNTDADFSSDNSELNITAISADHVSDTVTAIINDTSKTDDESKESYDNEIHRHTKRKRLLINSDSDDDSNFLSIKDSYNSGSLVQDPSENHENDILLKKQKKKARILEDSDESS